MPQRKRRPPRTERPPAEPDRRELTELEEQIAEDFETRQDLSEQGREELSERLAQHNSEANSPEVSARDIDARWDLARTSGEETFTGHAPTPDQDIVDNLGDAAGLTYADDEPLNASKIEARDEKRWELDPRSGAEEQAMAPLDQDEDDEDDYDVEDPHQGDFWDMADDLDDEVYDAADEDEDDEEDETG